MERIAFIVEESGERIDCLLNPETLEITRQAGLRPGGVTMNRLAGSGRSDDPLLFTGGGRTELVLDLLFDVELVESKVPPGDVRQLTRPLWTLAENSSQEHGSGRPPLVRLVWGKSWNIPCVVAAVAERFDGFSATGVPARSWLRVRLLRVSQPETALARGFDEELAAIAGRQSRPPGTVEAIGDGEAAAGYSGVRLDLLAAGALGSPLRWRELAAHNNIDDPLDVPAGSVLAVPNFGRGES